MIFGHPPLHKKISMVKVGHVALAPGPLPAALGPEIQQFNPQKQYKIFHVHFFYGGGEIVLRLSPNV